MKKINYLPIILSILLYGCGGSEKSQVYIFDGDDFEKNIKEYTISKGPLSEMGCAFSAILFTKEVLTVMQSGKELSLDDFGKGTTPATIELFKDKIVWSDIGLETKIKDNKIQMENKSGKTKGETIDFELKLNKDNMILIMNIKKDKTHCHFPFKKIN